MPTRCHSLFATSIVLVLGCSSNNSNTLAPEAQTLIGVEPEDFVVAGSCGTAVQRYVATLRDVTGSDKISQLSTSSAPFVVGSSPPTPCDKSTVFGNVVVSHAYEVAIDGYDRSDIAPLPNSAPSVMYAAAQYVAPRWTAVCHGWTDGDGGVRPGLAYPNMTVTLRDCTELGLQNP